MQIVAMYVLRCTSFQIALKEHYSCPGGALSMTKRIAVLWLGLLLFGCILASAQRLHDASKADLTRDASTKFDELTGKDNSVYDLALKNVDTVHAADLDLLRQRNLAT